MNNALKIITSTFSFVLLGRIWFIAGGHALEFAVWVLGALVLSLLQVLGDIK